MEDLNELIEMLLASEPETDKFTNAVASLATLSREEEAVRNRLASGDVLQILLNVLVSQLENNHLLATTLRCIGNACVSNPQACQTVTDFKYGWCEALILGRAVRGPDWQTWSYPSDEVRDLAIKVLYNICSQSEDAQKQCYHDNIQSLLVQVLSSASKSADDISLTIDLLLWITGHHKELSSFEGETDRKRALNSEQILGTTTYQALMTLPFIMYDDLDIEDWASLLEVMLVFLRDPASYPQTVFQGVVPKIWRLLESNERKVQEVEGNADDQKLLVALSTSLTWALSDVAATPLLTADYRDTTTPAEEPTPMLRLFIVDLSQFLSTGSVQSHTTNGKFFDLTDSDSLRLTTAACQVIGNLLHNLLPIENTIPPAIREWHVHKRLFALMANSDNADFLHSAAGLLIQLSRPSPEIREDIASDDNVLPALRRLGQHTMSELNQDALKLMRALGKDTPSVQERFKKLAGEVMATVAETQQAAANAQSGQPQLTATS